MKTTQQLHVRMLLRLIVSLAVVTAAIGALSDVAFAQTAIPEQWQPLEITVDGETELPASLNDVAPSCRYGVSASEIGAPFLTNVGIGWVYTFGAVKPDWVPDGVHFAHMIRLKQDKDGATYLPSYTVRPSLSNNGLGRLIDANPGALWIVGNEVDRFARQDDLMPDMYATAYHDVYHYIKSRDPSARVAVSGLVQVTPGRLQYLDKVLSAYRLKYGSGMPVDVWTFHAYIFAERKEVYNGKGGNPVWAWIANGTDPELAIKEPHEERPLAERLALCAREDYYCIKEHDDPALFEKQVVEMRRWMKINGYQNTPLILTEWSQLFWYIIGANGDCNIKDEDGNCFTPQRVTRFMERTLDYLDNATSQELGYPADRYRMVQQWAWYSMDPLSRDVNTDGNPSLLVNWEGTALTQMGQKYKQRIAQAAGNPNLMVERVLGGAIAPGEDGKLGVIIRNNGVKPTTQSFVVEFFSDEARTQKIGEAVVPAGLEGCAMQSIVAETTWASRPAGVHRFWVSIDRAGAIAGDDPGDNTGQGVVIASNNQLRLPLVTR
jgi:hypothetical protein